MSFVPAFDIFGFFIETMNMTTFEELWKAVINTFPSDKKKAYEEHKFFGETMWNAAMQTANTWQSMGTAPRDGTRFRVWIIDKAECIDHEYHARFNDRSNCFLFDKESWWIVDGIGKISCDNEIMMGWQPIPEFKQ